MVSVSLAAPRVALVELDLLEVTVIKMLAFPEAAAKMDLSSGYSEERISARPGTKKILPLAWVSKAVGL